MNRRQFLSGTAASGSVGTSLFVLDRSAGGRQLRGLWKPDGILRGSGHFRVVVRRKKYIFASGGGQGVSRRAHGLTGTKIRASVRG